MISIFNRKIIYLNGDDMINKIFIGIFFIGIVYSIFSNRQEVVIDVLLSSPKDAFYLFIDIYVLLIFWGGILEICKDSGLLKVLSSYIIFIIRPLFKRLNKDDEALQYISINFMANMLSMGSAATPFGLLAMKRLDEINNHSDIASDEMITFLLINTSGLCMIPTMLIAIRNQYHSTNAVQIIPYIIIISTICTILSIFLDKGGRKLAKS